MTAAVDCLLTLWMDCCFCMDSSRRLIPTTVHLFWLRVIHVLLECYYCNIVTQWYFSVTTLKKSIETVRANSIIAIIKDISFYHPIYAGTGGDGSKYLQEWVGMDSNYTGTGGDGTEILSPCRPLAKIRYCIVQLRHLAFGYDNDTYDVTAAVTNQNTAVLIAFGLLIRPAVRIATA